MSETTTPAAPLSAIQQAAQNFSVVTAAGAQAVATAKTALEALVQAATADLAQAAKVLGNDTVLAGVKAAIEADAKVVETEAKAVAADVATEAKAAVGAVKADVAGIWTFVKTHAPTAAIGAAGAGAVAFGGTIAHFVAAVVAAL